MRDFIFPFNRFLHEICIGSVCAFGQPTCIHLNRTVAYTDGTQRTHITTTTKRPIIKSISLRLTIVRCVFFFLSHAFVVSFHLSSFIFSVDIASFSVQLPLFALTYDSFCGLFDLDDFFFIMVAIVILCLVNSQFFCSE